MATLKEIGFELEPGDDLKKRFPFHTDEDLLNLSQERAFTEEVSYKLGGYGWYDFFVSKIEKFGGAINWDAYKE